MIFTVHTPAPSPSPSPSTGIFTIAADDMSVVLFLVLIAVAVTCYMLGQLVVTIIAVVRRRRISRQRLTCVSDDGE